MISKLNERAEAKGCDIFCSFEGVGRAFLPDDFELENGCFNGQNIEISPGNHIPEYF